MRVYHGSPNKTLSTLAPTCPFTLGVLNGSSLGNGVYLSTSVSFASKYENDNGQLYYVDLNDEDVLDVDHKNVSFLGVNALRIIGDSINNLSDRERISLIGALGVRKELRHPVSLEDRFNEEMDFVEQLSLPDYCEPIELEFHDSSNEPVTLQITERYLTKDWYRKCEKISIEMLYRALLSISPAFVSEVFSQFSKAVKINCTVVYFEQLPVLNAMLNNDLRD